MAVFLAHQARFEHGEAGGHPHHQRAIEQEREGVEDVGGLAIDRRMAGTAASMTAAAAIRPQWIFG